MVVLAVVVPHCHRTVAVVRLVVPRWWLLGDKVSSPDFHYGYDRYRQQQETVGTTTNKNLLLVVVVVAVVAIVVDDDRHGPK